MIGLGCVAVVIAAAIDAGVGHGGSSSSPSTAPPVATSSPTYSASAAPTPSASATPARRHPHASGPGAASPAPGGSAPTSAAPAPAPGASSSTGPRSAPPAGVIGTFRYSTSGYEQTNIPGTRRDYPATTRITNSHHGCGVVSTWKPDSQHTQRQYVCQSGSAVVLKWYASTISFFGYTGNEKFVCGRGAFVEQAGAPVGHTWSYRCKSADATASQSARIVGYETLQIGGKAVRTVHVHVRTTLSGSDSGSSTEDYWVATSEPLLVKQTGTVSASQQGVRYDEKYALRLDSLTPKR
jgi:hypothetical protein